jgi:hypothetical protein
MGKKAKAVPLVFTHLSSPFLFILQRSSLITTTQRGAFTQGFDNSRCTAETDVSVIHSEKKEAEDEAKERTQEEEEQCAVLFFCFRLFLPL